LKLKHQIDKLVRAAQLGAMPTEKDPLRFKPNPHALMDVEVEQQQQFNGDNVYKPPKILAQEFGDIDKEEVKQQEKRKRRSQRMLQSEMAKYIQEEYGDKPYETGEGVRTELFEEDEEDKLRREFEENSFIRLPVTRKDRRKEMEKIQNSTANIRNLDDFGDLAMLDDEERQRKADEQYLKKKRMEQIMKQIDEEKFKKRQNKKEDENIPSDSDEEPKPKKQKTERPPKPSKWTQGPVPSAERKIEAGSKRKIDKAIETNRGITRSRNKQTKNAKMKFRHKYEDAVKKRRSLVPSTKKQSGVYEGERSISKNLVKSQSLVHTG